MLGSNLSVIIDIGFTLGAMQNFSLTHREQLVAESTLVEVVTLLFEEKLQLLHEEARDKLVFSLF